MKYFTPELYARGNSRDDAELEGIEEEWELAIARYRRRWDKIKSAFPESVQRFDEQSICLHDAQVLSLGRHEQTFVLLLETEAPARKPVVLTFALEDEPVIQTGTLADGHTTK